MNKPGTAIYGPRGKGLGGIELAVRFVLWADALVRPPTPEQISAHFDICRASGYRWRNAYYAAKGISLPPPNRGH